MKLSVRWSVVADNVLEWELHLKLPRGRWPKEERRARLKLMDDLYVALASPIVLGKRSAK